MSQKAEESLKAFHKFLVDISHINVSKHLEISQQMYAVREFKVSQLSTAQALEIYQNIYIKFNRNMVHKSELNWWENQLRIFVWALVLYVELNNTKIEDLVFIFLWQTENDWEFFSLIFPHKKEILFEYQSINILKEHGQAKKWVPEEDDLFSQLVKQQKINFSDKGLKCKWSELAKLLYIESERKYFRTPKQCRQRWLNHLDPAKSKSEWSIREDYILIRYVYEKEKRWAEISKLLQNKRNEHSIKNRFKSLITKEQKFHKDKLQEAELVKCVYKRYRILQFRYTSHFGKLNNNHVNQSLGFQSPPKPQTEKVVPQHQNMQENQENYSRISSNFKPEPERLMFPFTWHLKNKDQQHFAPFKKPLQFMSCGNLTNPNEKDSKENMIGTNFSSIDNFPGFFTPQSTEYTLFSKFKTEINLPKKRSSYLEEENENDRNQNHQKSGQYRDMLDENFANGEDIELSNNYERFLPRMMDDFEDEFSFQKRFSGENGYFPGNHMEGELENDIDEEEKQIRAEIFLTEEPFELLREFFYKKEVKEKA